MTKEEFIKFLEPYKGKKLTKEEQYLIGEQHRKLPKKDKNWAKLAEFVGWKSSVENYRNSTKYYLKKANKIPSRVEMNIKNTDKIVNVEKKKKELLYIEQELNNKKLETEQELYKEKQKWRDERNAYRRALREDARVETFKEDMKEAISKLNSLPEIKYTCRTSINSPVEAILMISDLHIGVDVNNFYNTYNSEVAEKRVMKLVDEATKYCHIHQVSRLNVVNLGDLINGIIHVSIRLEQQFDVIEQIMFAAELLSKALNKLQNAAPEVIYRSCTDNHSRTMANKLENIEKEQFSKLIDWFVKERLKNSRIKFADDNIDDELGKFNLMNGKTVMFAHGHNDNANQAFQHFIGATKEFIDYVLLAHFHNEKLKSYQGMKIFVNGSIVGSEQYATSKRLFSSPSQTLLIFDNDNVLNTSIDLSNVD